MMSMVRRSKGRIAAAAAASALSLGIGAAAAPAAEAQPLITGGVVNVTALNGVDVGANVGANVCDTSVLVQYDDAAPGQCSNVGVNTK